MIGIGINENIYIAKAEFGDKKDSLILSFKQSVGKKLSMFEQLAAAEHIETEGGKDIRLFAPLPSKDDEKTEEKKVELAFADVNSTKGQLIHILEGYMVKADATLGDMYEGIGMSDDNFNQKMLNKDVLNLIFTNMVNGFLAKIKPWVGKEDPLFRLLLVRQSKDKHFPTLRKRFLTESPFWEPMFVAKKESKVKFTPYEIREELDSDKVIPKEEADKKDAPPAKTAEEIFGKGTSGLMF